MTFASHAQNLTASNNGITGGLAVLSGLNNLKHLDLASNNVTGSIPTALRANIVGNFGNASFAGNRNFSDWCGIASSPIASSPASSYVCNY